MNSDAHISPDGSTLTVILPLQFRRRGGRKQVIVPNGPNPAPFRQMHIDSTLVKALARAHRWQRILEDGGYGSISELAASEGINASYVARVMRLSLLAPDIVQGILDGRDGETRFTLDQLTKPFPRDWNAPRRC